MFIDLHYQQCLYCQLDTSDLTFALGDDGDPGSVGTSHTSAVTDNLSMTSIDSNQVSYQLLDQSIDSNSISFDKGSYGDRSDIEVPLMSECCLYTFHPTSDTIL